MNQLYPVFLKPDHLHFLIIGGGFVGEEKLFNLLRSSPQAKVRLVAIDIREEIYSLAQTHPNITLIKAAFDPELHLEGIHVAIVGTSYNELNREFHRQIKEKGILVNVADTPSLCDFYMCSVVTKGDLKIGISTNGKSPTFAKRFRQVLEEELPDDIPSLLDKLRVFRDTLSGDFEEKVRVLNELTEELVKKESR